MLEILRRKFSVTQGFLEKIAETDGYLEFEWKNPKFFSREQQYNYRVESPKFEFLGAECILCMECDIRYGANYNIDIVCKLKDGCSDFHTKASIEIKCFDGTIYKSVSGPLVVRPAVRDGTPRLLLSHSDLLRGKTKIAPEGVLTISCCLGVKPEYCERTTVDSATQTEISEGIHASTEVIEKYLLGTEDEESSRKEDLSDLKGTDKLAEDFKGLLLKAALFDTTIKISDREFRAHRAVLGARSSVFQSMFTHDTTERNTGTVEIVDCHPDVFQDFLLFLYSGKVKKLCSENVVHLYTLADKYDVQEMKTECLKFMIHDFQEDTFCDVVALALRHNETELLEIATDFFTKNTQKIIFTSEWQSFIKQYPIECNELYIKAFQSRDQK